MKKYLTGYFYAGGVVFFLKEGALPIKLLSHCLFLMPINFDGVNCLTSCLEDLFLKCN